MPATSSIGTFGIHAMLVEEVDAVDPQAPQHALDGDAWMCSGRLFWPGPRSPVTGVVLFPNLLAITTWLADGYQGLADQLLVSERAAVGLRRVEERDAPLDRPRGEPRSSRPGPDSPP